MLSEVGRVVTETLQSHSRVSTRIQTCFSHKSVVVPSSSVVAVSPVSDKYIFTNNAMSVNKASADGVPTYDYVVWALG